MEVRWNHKKSIVEKAQTIIILQAPRSRVFMMLGTAPEEARLLDVVCLTTQSSQTPDWEVKFNVNTLHGLKLILNHLTKSKLNIEFALEQ